MTTDLIRSCCSRYTCNNNMKFSLQNSTQFLINKYFITNIFLAYFVLQENRIFLKKYFIKSLLGGASPSPVKCLRKKLSQWRHWLFSQVSVDGSVINDFSPSTFNILRARICKELPNARILKIGLCYYSY